MAVHKQGYRLPRSLRVAALGLLAILVVGGRAGAADKNAVLVVDANTGQTIYQNAADAHRHPASLAKMMTLYIVFEQIEQGRLSYQTKIKASANAAAAAPLTEPIAAPPNSPSVAAARAAAIPGVRRSHCSQGSSL